MVVAKVINEEYGTFGKILLFDTRQNEYGLTWYVDHETGEYYYPEDIEINYK